MAVELWRPTSAFLTEAWRPTSVQGRANVRRRIRQLAKALERTYRTPDLGNLDDPLDEAIYIMLTYQTDLDRARMVWRGLKTRFPSWGYLLAAPSGDLEEVLQPGGFHRSRARLIRRFLEAVRLRWGRLSLSSMDDMQSREAEKELRALPGLDIKGARCVLLYSLRRPVLPVDSNTFRFMQRYGVVVPSVPYRRIATHDDLQALVPPGQRHTLHVNLVAHGQTTCLPRNPRCGNCPVSRTCWTARATGRS